jgi:tetratricopeptide (TPR) repeat protein
MTKESANTITLILLALFFTTIGSANGQRRSKKEKSTPETAITTYKLEEEALTAEGMKFMMLDEPAKALPIFEKLVKKSPLEANSYFLLAKALIKLERFDEASENASQAYKLNKSNRYYAQQLGELYAKRKKYAEAAAVYEDLVKEDPSNLQYGIELAAIYVFSDQPGKAINAYDRLEKSIGITEEVIHQKQQLYLRLNELEKALQEAQKLIQAEPDEVDYRIELAELLIANDRANDAIKPLEEALRLNPDEAQAHVLLADIYRRSGELEKCNAELKLVFANSNLEADPKVRVLSGYLMMIKTQKERDEALMLAKQLVETHPSSARACVIYGDLLVQTGKKGEGRDQYARATRLDGADFQVWSAVLQLDQELNQLDSILVHSELALERFPTNGIFWFYNGSANLYKKNYKKAVAGLEESKNLIQDNVNLIRFVNANLGDAYNGLGDHAKSDQSYDLVLKEDPDNDHVLNNYSYFLSLRKEKLDLALQMSERLVQRNADNSTYLDTYAWVLYIRKDYKKARLYLEKAISSTQKVSGTIIEHYGDVLFQLGEKNKAVEQWKKAKQIGETTETIDKKIATGILHEQ